MWRYLLLFIPYLAFLAEADAQSRFGIFHKEKPGSLNEINQRLIDFTSDILKEDQPQNVVLDANYIPVFSDDVYQKRMEKIDIQSPIRLDFKPIVRRYIEAYAVRHREKTAKIIERSELYFPLFEEYLDKYQLPLELKYLSVIESALDPKAKSRSGAMGLWQFMFNASKMFDLRVTSYVDERLDPEKSTEAACKYLQYLHRIFGDWQLALAAYNGGPGVVREAIQRSGGKTDFWEISSYLPEQTRNYVPAFIAVNYVMNYSSEHNIVPSKNVYPYFRISPVTVSKPISFQHVAEALELSIDVVRDLNPIYKHDLIPLCEIPAKLVLPIEKVGAFIDLEDIIYGMTSEPKKYLELQKELSTKKGKYCIIHTVKPGEYFHKIAMNYGCTINNIKEWNGMDSPEIYAGQHLKIWVYPSDTLAQKPQRDPLLKKSKFLLYQVQAGDSLRSIADRFDLKSTSDLLELNRIPSKAIEPGMVLKIICYE
ncbi:transglycosylase SLT domain-containing protein [Labilibaculum sp.]|uniref:lytic transglycosylase domain-containing protein n=1 Tax=Labilibaculum sp. TaxID=2060723 RepID=UPI0035695CD4